MSKKVLIVEQSLAVRGIAESLLRQYGFEVYTAGAAAQAQEILGSSKIDLLLVGSDVQAESGQHYFEALGADKATAMVPLLVLHDPATGSLDYPPEAIVAKPFTPREFMEKVTVFGGAPQPAAVPDAAPVKVLDLEDEIIDAALGLDKIEVSDAEVLGNDTGMYRIRNKKVTTESMIGYDYKSNTEDSAITKKKIDEINVPAEPGTPAKAGDFLGADSAKLKTRPAETMSASSKIEIVPDQYGIVRPEDIIEQTQSASESSSHDYDWFVKEMKNAGSPNAAPTAVHGDSGSLRITSPSDLLSPSTPAPASTPAPVPEAPALDSKPTTHAEAVGKFISEFRKEIEKIAGEAVPVTTAAEVVPKPEAPTTGQLNWIEALEKISPTEIRAISTELIAQVAAQIAERVAARLDPEMVYVILRECFIETLNNLLKSKSSEQ